MGDIHFTASQTDSAQTALARLTARYGQVPADRAAVIVALGGDGLMLSTLHQMTGLPVYGMNRGTYGFLMNDYAEDDLPERIAAAEITLTNPLSMVAGTPGGGEYRALAINEVSLLRAGAQAAKLRISVNGQVRMPELVADGVLLSTPAGSTAYNYSAHGPILPMGSEVLALTAIAAFRPRRWRGAILPKTALVRFDVLEPEKRPVMADADSQGVERVEWVEIRSEPDFAHTILFDPGHGMEERLMREQFV
ncbi:MAG: NAD kinase [Paracoccus sp. (in: a-proteobacteria)]|uniref:NAD kinase n=1 Tax=Paracoccus sp. TaxID=267 RepID=UPI0026DFFF7D|nr:NAD kinase [Paracoccus sp. (in: a-proteobacteria)]MDO5614152.1 NAD kinase [Paracoccus sp. (in: a-proteobacteria)]